MTSHRILGAETNWTPDCHHLFYLTATEFIKIPMSLLLPLLEHKFVQGGKYGECGVFRHTSYLVQEQFHKTAFIRAMSPAEVGLFFCSHLISIKQLQFQIQKPPAPQLRSPNYTLNTLPGF